MPRFRPVQSETRSLVGVVLVVSLGLENPCRFPVCSAVAALHLSRGSTMALLYSTGAANYVGDADLAAATAWNIEKIGLGKEDVVLDHARGSGIPGFGKDDCALCRGTARG